MTNLGLAARARITPDKRALVTEDVTITFAELDVLANRAAHALRALGGKDGARVGIGLHNRIEFYLIAAGAARLGLDVVPIPWRAAEDEARYLVEDGRCGPLIAEDGAWPALAPISLERFTDELRRAPEHPEGDGIDPILIRYYTSGTTGRPKAVERARAAPAEALTFSIRHLEQFDVHHPDGVHLVCGPLYHTAPLAFSTQALQAGQTVVVPARFDARAILATIERERVTWTFMVPIHLARILEVFGDHNLSSLRRVLHAGAPCPVEVKRRALKLFPPETLWEFYGTTEGRATLISPEEWLRKPGSVGRALPGITLRVLDAAGRPLPPGETGLVYFSPMGGVRFTYAGAPEKTAETWRDGLFTVGDMGYLDDDGYLFLTDRAQDLIITGGANVYPAEVENVLAAHPAVSDVAVIGIPDEEWGESVHALVQARAAVEAAELIEFCRARLAHYKCPKSVEFVEELARDPNGKLRKRELREPHWRGRARQI